MIYGNNEIASLMLAMTKEGFHYEKLSYHEIATVISVLVIMILYLFRISKFVFRI